MKPRAGEASRGGATGDDRRGAPEGGRVPIRRGTARAAVACLIAAACIATIAQALRPDRLPDDFTPESRSRLAGLFRKYKSGGSSEVLKVNMLGSAFDVHVVDSGRGEAYGFAESRGGLKHLWLLTDEYEAFAYNDEAIFLRIGLKHLSKFR